MGEYSTHAKISFCGTQAEISMMKNLLNLMNKLDYIDNFAEEFGRLSEKSSLVYDFEFDDDIIENALLGELEDRGEGEHYNRYWPSFDLTLAPKLFAALFPASKFQYSVEVEYSVSINDTPYLTAVFEGDTLMIRESYLYSTVSSNIKKIKAICMNMIKTDPDAKAKYDSYREEEDLEEDEEIDWNFLLSELVDDPTETMASLYKFKKKLPSRNTKYEKSFFSEGDLQEFLVSEQIKAMDMSLAEYIKTCSFTDEQFQHLLLISTACRFDGMTAFLKEEKQHRSAL